MPVYIQSSIILCKSCEDLCAFNRFDSRFITLSLVIFPLLVSISFFREIDLYISNPSLVLGYKSMFVEIVYYKKLSIKYL